MIRIRRVLGGWGVAWNDGTEFIDPDLSRATDHAMADAHARGGPEVAEFAAALAEIPKRAQPPAPPQVAETADPERPARGCACQFCRPDLHKTTEGGPKP